jgi:hypothetical protein
MTGVVSREVQAISRIASRRRDAIETILAREKKEKNMRDNIQNILMAHPGFPVNSLSGKLGSYIKQTNVMKQAAINNGHIIRGTVWREL